MPTQNETIVLDIVINNQNAARLIKEQRQDIQELRQEQRLLDRSIDENNERWQQYEAEIKRLQASNVDLTRTIRDNNRSLGEQEGSLVSMRAELSRLNQAFINLSAAERETAAGQALAERVRTLREEIGGIEQSVGDFRRQVGNYENSINSALDSTGAFGVVIRQLQGGVAGIQQSLRAGQVAVVNFGRSLLALLGNPIVAIIAAIAAAVTALVAVFNRAIETARGNEQQFSQLQQVMQPLRVIADQITIVFEGLASTFLNVASTVASAITRFSDFIGVTDNLTAKTQEYIAVEQQRYELTLRQRRLDEQISSEMIRASELRANAMDRENFSDQERLSFLQEYQGIARRQAEERKAIAEENLRLLEEEASRTMNSAETEDRLTQARTAVNQATIDLNNQMRELNGQTAELNTRIRTEAQTAAREAQARSKALADAERDALRQLEDSALAILQEGIQARRQQLELQYQRETQDLRNKLANDNNLTEAARNAINQTLVNLQVQYQQQVDKLSQESINNQIQRETERINLQLQIVREGTIEEFTLREQLLEQNRQSALLANQQLNEELRQSEADINAAYDAQLAQQREERQKAEFDRQSEMMAQEFENRLLQAQENSDQILQINLERAQAEYDALLALDSAQKTALYENELAYTNAVLQAKNAISEASKEQQEAEREALSTQLSSFGDIAQGFSDVFGQFAEDSVVLAGLSKTLALFNIALATGEAISKGIAAAQSVPFPGNLAAIATTITTVLTNIAQATALVNGANTPTAPSFGDGGLITGNSHESGGVNINAEGGEAVLTKQAMANPLLRSMASAINVAGGGIPFANTPMLPTGGSDMFGMEGFKESLKEAMQELRLEVNVREVTRVQNRVRYSEQSANVNA